MDLKKNLSNISRAGARRLQPFVLDGGIEKDVRRAQEYLVSHLEARRTPKSDWGSSHTATVLVSLQIYNPHWCLDNVENRRSVDRLEISLLAALSKLSPRSKTSSTYTPQRLSADINALLATFLDPRDFYDHDLVAILKRHITDVVPYTAYTAHAYSSYVIALCNNGQELDDEHAQRILGKQNQDGGFYLGVNEAAYALMALSCVNQSGENLKRTENIVRYIGSQRHNDGSYGNLYTTALVLQAYNVTGVPVDTATRKEATLSWLLRSCYGNAALKDPEVASAVLLALSGHSVLDINQITGISHKKRTSVVLPSGGQQVKFRYLAPEVAPVIPESLSGSGRRVDDVNQNATSKDRAKGTAVTDSNGRQALAPGNDTGHLDTEASTNQERAANGAGAKLKDGTVAMATDDASPKHRWKTWKRSFVDVDEVDNPLKPPNADDKTTRRKTNKRRQKIAITANESGLGYIFLNRCLT